jgi:hypothetical protein
MPEVLIETIPFVVGALLGFLTLDRLAFQANLGRVAGVAVIAGVACSAMAGELGHDLLTSGIAIAADSAAVVAGWIGGQIALRQGRALLSRA